MKFWRFLALLFFHYMAKMLNTGRQTNDQTADMCTWQLLYHMGGPRILCHINDVIYKLGESTRLSFQIKKKKYDFASISLVKTFSETWGIEISKLWTLCVSNRAGQEKVNKIGPVCVHILNSCVTAAWQEYSKQDTVPILSWDWVFVKETRWFIGQGEEIQWDKKLNILAQGVVNNYVSTVCFCYLDSVKVSST